ncbi:serine hydrolase domain-containing protein [Temperatibacter marinus]|uniref:Serine hydrolase domain-containing protein n=1 Tax=Temperatibacter marinus TaxID=1456591 RepID=A0AA52H8D5_9PROT|nr:serine hydrolase domain-containing protein [Temperatibacter marinus]WND02016.1 serine hydrolase domain-containing protein [Temperatibacter marinus]
MLIKRSLFAFASICISLCGGSQSTVRAGDWQTVDGRYLDRQEIRATVERLIEAHNVTGLGIGLISQGKVFSLETFGYRDIRKKAPLEVNTLMYGASLTKATFAYYVMQLVDEGLIDLDKPISAYLPKSLHEYEGYQDLEGDERWRRLTFRLLLTHQSGFANWRFLPPEGGFDRTGKLKFFLNPGSRYAYSGEGFLLAQRVLEYGLGLNVKKEMQSRIFNKYGMKRTVLAIRGKPFKNQANNYSLEGRNVGKMAFKDVNAAGSMQTTLSEWATFLAAVVRGDGLSDRSKKEMIKTQIRIKSARQFPTFSDQTTSKYDSIALGYGLGWGVFKSPYGEAFFKEGHDDGTANYSLCIEGKKTCILLMSNSVRAEGIFKELVDTLLGDVGLPWEWEQYTPYDYPSSEVK